MPLRISIVTLLWAVLLTGTAHAQQAPTYTVRSGDTLYRIAQEHGLTVEQLQRLNDLEGTVIRVGQVLVVGRPAAPPTEQPVPPDSTQVVADTMQSGVDTVQAPPPDVPQPTGPPPPDTVGRIPEPAAEATGYGAHVVRPGETIYGVAARYGASVDTLRTLNAPVPTFLSPGATLRLPRAGAIRAHVVRPGETLYDLAAQYGVSVRALAAANDLQTDSLQTDSLRTGQRLRIPGLRPPAPPGALPPPDTSGLVHVYPASFAGRLTASGEHYDPQRFTASHSTLSFGTIVLLTNPVTGRHAFAKVTDRGPLDPHFLLDVSAAVARQLGLQPGSEQPIEVRVVN